MLKFKRISQIFIATIILLMLSCLIGCVTKGKYNKTIQMYKEEITNLEKTNEDIKNTCEEDKKALQVEMEEIREKMKRQIDELGVKLEDAKKAYEASLYGEVLGEILFDSGSARIKQVGEENLSKIAKLFLSKDYLHSKVSIEGHTDNEPIKYSGYKSNWELSLARACAVVHFFIKKSKIKPHRLKVVGYSEHKPIATNKTKEGRQLNRRVAIVIYPQ